MPKQQLTGRAFDAGLYPVADSDGHRYPEDEWGGFIDMMWDMRNERTGQIHRAERRIQTTRARALEAMEALAHENKIV